VSEIFAAKTQSTRRKKVKDQRLKKKDERLKEDGSSGFQPSRASISIAGTNYHKSPISGSHKTAG
jgi:hypothetical protein